MFLGARPGDCPVNAPKYAFEVSFCRFEDFHANALDFEKSRKIDDFDENTAILTKTK